MNRKPESTVKEPAEDETENLYMIRENTTMEYVAVIGRHEVGLTKHGKRAMHFRDEVIANEQCSMLFDAATTRTYSVIVSQTSVGIK